MQRRNLLSEPLGASRPGRGDRALDLATSVAPERRRALNRRPIAPGGGFVLYWMTAFRRLEWNAALEVAVDAAVELGRPLVILEGLRADYPWASWRFHRFVMDGMVEHAARLEGSPVTYFPYVEPAPGDGKGLLSALAEDACLVVADDWPAFFHPRMLSAASRLPVRVEAVDSCGLLPTRVASQAYPSAYAFRRFLQRVLLEWLTGMPAPTPLERAPTIRAELPPRVMERWPATAQGQLRDRIPGLRLVDAVGPTGLRGGATAARELLGRFLARRLSRYAEERSIPDENVVSGLSPYLHFGHISPHEVFAVLAETEGWAPDRLGSKATGKREGWWGMSRPAEAFLDQLVTWRELGFNAAVHLPDFDKYASLPAWARTTLEEHSADRRPHRYTQDQLDAGETHDRLWNAAQRQLREEGTVQNYLRMLWGKKILEWTASGEEAAQVMVTLNNRYALDGRDPNSYSGIFWCLGRYDRPWGPERPIFGKIRYMSSANTARKFRVAGYIARHGDDLGQPALPT